MVIRLISQIISEIVLTILYPILSISLQTFQKINIIEEKDQKGKTIIIVERWLSLNIRHLYWRRYLTKKGYRVHLINFPLWHKDFKDSSLTLSQFMKDKKITDGTLVGISSGAITCLLYLEELGGWDRIDKFISIGAPFKGTWMMLFLSFIKSGRELLPGSDLTNKIASLNLNQPEKTICIKAEFDEMVPFGSILDGAKKVVIPIFGHNNLHLRHRETYQIIAREA